MPASTTHEEPGRGLSAPFGGASFRSRFTDAVWQGPTWSFAILLLAIRFLDGGPVRYPSWFVGGFVLIMAATTLAVFVPWERLPAWTQPVVPVVDLVGAGLMVAADPVGAPTVMLLGSLPAVWLAFEFGRAGMASAITFTVLAAAVSYAQRPDVPDAPTSSGVVVSALFVVGLAVTARLMSRILLRIGHTLRSQALDIDRTLALAEERLELLSGVLASIDVGVMLLERGVEPRLNDKARAMVARMQLSASTPEHGAAHVYEDDGLTRVQAAEQAISRAAAGEEFTGVLQRIGRPGDQQVVAMSARQLTHLDETSRTTVLTAWDATDLMDAIRVREEFLTTVSHELRTPLTAIGTSMEVLTDLVAGRVGAESQRLVSAVNRNTGLLSARIDQLLSSAQSTGTAFTPVRTDVTALVRASLDKHAAQIEASGLTLADQVQDDVVAELDPTRVEQVVDNLVSNAVKYSSPGGRVSVSLRVADPGTIRDDDPAATPDGHRIVLRVTDTGTGMTHDEQRQAFDRFYRAPRARAGAIAGLGVGLSLVRSIVERHHGSIDLSSAPGMGTTVTVTLPIAGAGA